jgi:hypothetical protein
MRLRCAIDGVDYSSATDAISLQITQDSTQAVSTCSVRLFQPATGPGSGGRYDVSTYDSGAVFGWSITEWQEIVLWNEDTGQRLFAGFVLAVQRIPAGPHLFFSLSCSDYGILLDRRIITQTWAAGTPDSQIILEALALVPELTSATIETIAADLGEIDFKDQRIRDLFDAICTLTGGEYYVSYAGALNYYRAGSIPAPFGLSDDAPDGVTNVGFDLETHAHDFSEGANSVLVLGAIDGGVEIKGTARDDASIAQYGLLEATIANRQIVDVVTARLHAQAQVYERSQPKEILKVALFSPGLARGQTVNVYSLRLGIFAAYILRTLEIVVAAPDRLDRLPGRFGRNPDHRGGRGFRGCVFHHGSQDDSIAAP